MTSWRRRTNPRSSVVAGTAALVLAVAVTGCSVLPGGPDPEPVAEKLADALSAGDLSAIDFTEAGAAESYAELAEPLSGFETTVEVTAVSEDGDAGSATLAWSQSRYGVTWEHETTADLVERDGEWRVRWDAAILASGLGAGERLEVSWLAPRRGRILGAGGTALVKPRPVYRVGLDKTRARPAEQAAAAVALADLLDIDAPGFRAEVRSAGPKAFVEALVLRRDQATARLRSAIADIPGGRAIAGELPLAPTKEFAAPILGTVGPATAELIEESEGRLRSGDDAGLSGLQNRYDDQLFGTRGLEIAAVPEDDADAEPRVLFEQPPSAGGDVRTTLDQRLQSRAEELLSEIGPASALVALRPSTGAVLAAASGPGSAGLNTATYGQYAPGSTFKMVTSLALLRAGVTPASRISCPEEVFVDGKRFGNYDGYPPSKTGQITLRDAVANSCNTAFISELRRIKPKALASAGAALGFGVDHDLGFPAYFGELPPPVSETEAAADLIGQGRVLASPMVMATVLASIVEERAVVPVLLPEHVMPSTPDPVQPLTSREAAALRGMLHAVVREGSGRVLAGLEPPRVIAKTGTAEYGDTEPLRTRAWMVGAQGDLAVAVFVATGQSGSGTAGPILASFLRSAG